MANRPLKSIKFPGLSDTYTVPEVDSTLTGSGKAADAKVVGDQLGDLKSIVSDNNIITGKITGANIVSNGLVEPNTDYDLYYTPVTQGKTYYAKTGGNLLGGFFTDTPAAYSATYNNDRINQSSTSVVAPITGYFAVRCTKEYQYPQIVEVKDTLTPTVLPSCSIYSNGTIIDTSGYNVYLYDITGIKRIRVDGGSIIAFYESAPVKDVTPSIDALRYIRTLSGAELIVPTVANYIAIRHTETPSVANIDSIKRTVEDLEYIKSFNTKTVTFSKSGVYINQNGTETQGAEYKSTDYVPAVGGSSFAVHAYYSGDARFASYDANKNLVDVWSNANSLGSLVTYNLKPNVRYVRWTLNINYDYSLDANTAYITNTIGDLINTDTLTKNIIAPVIGNMVADTNLSVNDFRIVGNTLYKITSNIAAGGTLTVGTNCVATTLAEQISAILNA